MSQDGSAQVETSPLPRHSPVRPPGGGAAVGHKRGSVTSGPGARGGRERERERELGRRRGTGPLSQSGPAETPDHGSERPRAVPGSETRPGVRCGLLAPSRRTLATPGDTDTVQCVKQPTRSRHEARNGPPPKDHNTRAGGQPQGGSSSLGASQATPPGQRRPPTRRSSQPADQPTAEWPAVVSVPRRRLVVVAAVSQPESAGVAGGAETAA